MVAGLIPGIISWASSLFGQTGVAVNSARAEQSAYGSLNSQMKSMASINDFNANVINPQFEELAKKSKAYSARIGAYNTLGNLVASSLGANVSVWKSNIDLVNKANGMG